LIIHTIHIYSVNGKANLGIIFHWLSLWRNAGC